MRLLLERAGMSRHEADSKARRFANLRDALKNTRSDRSGDSVWFVPGRIEVLGKHTDYAGGRSLVCAAERGFCAISAARTDERVVIADVGGAESVTIDAATRSPDLHWGTYPLTVVRRLTRNFPDAVRGVDIVFDSDLPPAAGMSSSSALMIGVLLALVRANGLDSSDSWHAVIHDRVDLAAYAATIENGASFRSLSGDRGVGTAGGSEDHVAILCSQAGRLAQFSFSPIRHERTIALPPSLVFAVGVSGVEARKAGDARDDYNRASNDVRRILDTWREATGRDDDSLAAALDSSAEAADRLRSLIRQTRSGSADAMRLEERLEQFIHESTIIIPTAADQLASGDFGGFGTSVDRSQELAERLLRNQVPETIALVRSARDLGAIAASAFGAGFGGSVWALVERRAADDFVARWTRLVSEYVSARGSVGVLSHRSRARSDRAHERVKLMVRSSFIVRSVRLQADTLSPAEAGHYWS